MTGLVRDRVVAITSLVLFVVVQLVVPISRFTSDEAERFGWQMFSKNVKAPVVQVEANGELQRIELEDYMARVRADIVPSQRCSRAICAG